MRYHMVTINVMWDNEAYVWIAYCDEIGLATESASYDDLMERIDKMAPEMAHENQIKITGYRIVTGDRQCSIA